jgi:hypothetical protein
LQEGAFVENRDEERPDDIEAVGAIVKALRPFSAEVRRRIVDSALTLLGGAERRREAAGETVGSGGVEPQPEQVGEAATQTPRDVRELRNQKHPRTANEMAVVAAYYLSRLAPPGIRKDFITSADVTKYFEQAGFLQPGDPLMTLVNAKNAGYFDSLGSGKYRLNPVGFNLVTHGLPRKGEGGGEAPRLRPKRRAKKAPRGPRPARKR